jgi:hypothetical protein
MKKSVLCVLLAALVFTQGCGAADALWKDLPDITKKVSVAAAPEYWEKQTALEEVKKRQSEDQDSLQKDIVIVQNFLSEKQELEREETAIMQELKELHAEMTAWEEGPEFKFLLTLTDKEIVAYKEYCSPPDANKPRDNAEKILAIRRVAEVFPKEKMGPFLELCVSKYPIQTKAIALLEKNKDLDKRMEDYRRRFDAFVRYVEAKEQRQQRNAATFEQQQAQERLQQQQRELESYRTSMLNTMKSIESDLGDINRHQWQEH